MDNTKVLLRNGLNLGFTMNYFSFYCKFCAFRIILFYIAYFYICFYPRINKPNIHINNGISSFQNGLNDPNSTGFYFNSKVTEGSHKGENVFKFLGTSSQNVHF